MHIFRQVFLHLFHTLIYSVRNLNMVGSRLWNNYDTYHRHTVHFHVTFDVGRPQFGTSDVTETHDAVVLFLDNQVVKLVCSVHQS